jgi:hypothetical protein
VQSFRAQEPWSEEHPAGAAGGAVEQNKRTGLEELIFKTAELDAILQEAGFRPMMVDPEASRDFSYRARYLRNKGALYPRLHANLEYYLATQAFSLRISAEGMPDEKTYFLLVKNHKGDLKELLDRYFESVRRNEPFQTLEGRD